MRYSLVMLLLCAAFLQADAAGLKVRNLPGKKIQITSSFNKDYQLIQVIAPGRNGQFNFQRATLSSPEKSYKFFYHSDDIAPWKINQVYLGANHGEPRVKKLNFRQPHGLKDSDLGTMYTDQKKRKFYLLQILNAREVLFLPENVGKKDSWYFTFSMPTPPLVSPQKTLTDFKSSMHQMFPALKNLRTEITLDGKKLPADGEISGRKLVVREYSELIAPDSILDALQNNPGVKVNMSSPELEIVLKQEITYEFTDDNRWIIDHQAEFQRNLFINLAGFIQACKLDDNGFDTHRLIIPGVRPYKGLDFAKGENFIYRTPYQHDIHIKSADCLSPTEYPSRFIQRLSGKNSPSLAFEIGYLTDKGLGMPAERRKNTAEGVWVYKRTGKIYPMAIMNKKYQAGDKVHCRTYRWFYDFAQQ